MTKEQGMDLEKAQALLIEHENKRKQEFANKINALMEEYGYELSSRFTLFGQVINPPIGIILKQQRE